MDKEVSVFKMDKILSMHKEREAEADLIREFKALGAWAAHMDTTVDGFPDILVLGRKTLMIEMKYVNTKNPRIWEIMEPTQPVFMHNVRNKGMDEIYLCIASEDNFKVFSTDGILELSMTGAKIDELALMLCTSSAHEVALFLLERPEL